MEVFTLSASSVKKVNDRIAYEEQEHKKLGKCLDYESIDMRYIDTDCLPVIMYNRKYCCPDTIITRIALASDNSTYKAYDNNNEYCGIIGDINIVTKSTKKNIYVDNAKKILKRIKDENNSKWHKAILKKG